MGIGFDFKIFAKKTICHFRFGQNEIMRFYPEYLVNFMPKLFVKPSDISRAQYLNKLYSNKYKNGWCVELNDSEFDEHYKRITGFDHISVCCNRLILNKDDEPPIICFMDSLFDELKSMNIDIESIQTFINERDYDSDSLIDDIQSNESYIVLHLKSHHVKIKSIVQNYHSKAQKNKKKRMFSVSY